MTLNNLFVSTEFSFAICLVIVFVAFWFGIKLNSFISSVDSDLAQINGLLAQKDLNFSNFKNVSETLNSPVGTAWRNYLGQVHSAPFDTMLLRKGEKFSGMKSENFLNEEEIFYGIKDWNLCKEMPSLLTGAGILFTFLGLAIGVHDAIGKSYGDVNGFFSPFSMENLFKGAGIAFYTSFAGLLCSLVYSVFMKKRLGTVRERLVRTTQNLDKKIPSLTPADFQCEILRNLAETKETVANSLEEAFRLSLRDFSSTMKNLAEDMSISLLKCSQEIQRSIEGFNSSLDSVRNRFLGEVEGSFAKTASEIKNKVDSFEKTVIENQDSLTRQNQEMLSSFDSIVIVIRKLNEQISALGEELENRVNSLQDERKTIDSEIRQSISEAAALLKHEAEAAEHAEESMLRLAKALLELEQKTTQFYKDGSTSASELLELLNTSKDNIQKALKSMDGRLLRTTNLQTRTETLLSSLQENVGDFNSVDKKVREISQDVRSIQADTQRIEYLDQKLSEITEIEAKMHAALQSYKPDAAKKTSIFGFGRRK